MKDGSNQSASGTNDFTGGTIDALVANLNIGVTQTGASGGNTGNGIGTLTLNAGTIDVNNLTNGCSKGTGTLAGSDIGAGTINVNGAATLKVNNVLVLAQNIGTGTGTPSGAVNVKNGTLIVNSVLCGTGSSVIAARDATLIVSNRVGAPGAPLGGFWTTNATIHLRLNGVSIVTNIVASALYPSGLSTIQIDSVTNVSATTTFPLISYASTSGSAANFTVGTLPFGCTGALVDNIAHKTIDLQLTVLPSPVPAFSTFACSDTNFVFNVTNGYPGRPFYLLGSSNLGLPLSNWTPLATNCFDNFGCFFLTNPLDPNVPQMYFRVLQP
jgi:hypothetical protein